MSSLVHFRDSSVRLNNRQFGTIIDFVGEVAEKTARDAEERAHVAAFKEKIECFYPGVHIDLAVDFPTASERRFWARCFHDLSRWIFLRKIGSHDVDFWQATAIHQARALGDLFVEAAREHDGHFWPDSEDSRLFDAYYNPPKA